MAQCYSIDIKIESLNTIDIEGFFSRCGGV